MTHISETEFNLSDHLGTFAGAFINGQFAALEQFAERMGLPADDLARVKSGAQQAARHTGQRLGAFNIGVGTLEDGASGAALAINNVATAAVAGNAAAITTGSPLIGVMAAALTSMGIDKGVDVMADTLRNQEIGRLIFDLSTGDDAVSEQLRDHAALLASSGHPGLHGALDAFDNINGDLRQQLAGLRDFALAQPQAIDNGIGGVAELMRDHYGAASTTLGDWLDQAAVLRDAVLAEASDTAAQFAGRYDDAVTGASDLMTHLDELQAAAGSAAADTYDDLSEALVGLWEGFIADTQQAMDTADGFIDESAANASVWVDQLTDTMTGAAANAGARLDDIADLMMAQSGLDGAGREAVKAQIRDYFSGQFDRLRDSAERLGEFVDGRAGPVAGYVHDMLDSFGSAEAARLPKSPLVLDLDGDGLDLIALAATTARFDHDGDLFQEASGWVGADDGLLVHDLNGNGAVDHGGELFGTATRIDEVPAADGFAALAALDTNLDGVLDASDPAFTALRVWRDVDHNGKTAPTELVTLDSAGVAAIALTPSASNLVVAGHAVPLVSTFIRSDGSAGLIADVFFTTDAVDTVYAAPVPLSIGALQAPEIRGYGTLRALGLAMSEDPTLLGMVQQYLAAPDLRADTEHHAVSAILLRWGEVEDIAPDTRGGAFDARKLVFLEQFLAQPYVGQFGSSDPHAQAANTLHATWTTLVDSVALRLRAQSDAPGMLAAVDYDRVGDHLTSTMSANQSAAAALAVAPTGLEAELAYWAHIYARMTALGAQPDADVRAALEAAVADTEIAPLLSHAFVSTRLFERTLNDNYSTSSNRDSIVYGDDGDSRILSSGDNDLVFAGGGNDQISGFGDGGVYFGGAGNDIINGARIHGDGGDGEDVLFAGTGSVLRGGNGADTLGTFDHHHHVELDGGDGNDVLRVGPLARNIRFIGGRGDDQLIGSSNSDTYLFDAGDGHDTIIEFGGGADNDPDTLLFGGGINADDVRVSRETNNLILSIADDSVQINGWYNSERYIEHVEFADGTHWDHHMVHAMSIAANGTEVGEIFTGTSGNDVINGLGGNDYFRASPGDNILFGGAGNDRIMGGAGAESLYGGGGDDLLYDYDSGGANTVDGGAGNDRIYVVGNSNGNRLSGGPGDDWLILGRSGTDNVLAGGPGQDNLRGSYTGGDTYLFNRGDGIDRILEYAPAPADPDHADRIVLGADIAPADVRIERVGGAWILTLDGGSDQIIVPNWYFGIAPIEVLQFADGTQWHNQVLHDLGLMTAASAGADIIVGLELHDDIIDAGDGDDALYGLSGNDRLFGGNGDDRLDGGPGTNLLLGGAGDDTYLIGDPDGVQLVFDTLGHDELIFDPATFDAEDLWFSMAGDDLLIDLVGATGRVVVDDFTTHPVSSITLDDRMLSAAGIDTLVAVMAPYAPPVGTAALPPTLVDIVDPAIAQAWVAVV